MPKFIFQMGVNARCYGSVEAEADTIKQAVAMLTADYVGEEFSLHETTWDGLTGLSIIDVTDEDGNDIHEDYAGTDLPSEYDSKPDYEPLIACIRDLYWHIKATTDLHPDLEFPPTLDPTTGTDIMGRTRSLVAGYGGDISAEG